jgi:hypothetical protein
MLRCERVQRRQRIEGFESDVPVVLDLVGINERKGALLAFEATPVIDQLVASDPDEPRRGERLDSLSAHLPDRCHERLGGEVLGDRRSAATPQQIPVDRAERVVVERQQLLRMVGLAAHRFTPHTTSSSHGGRFLHQSAWCLR